MPGFVRREVQSGDDELSADNLTWCFAVERAMWAEYIYKTGFSRTHIHAAPSHTP